VSRNEEVAYTLQTVMFIRIVFNKVDITEHAVRQVVHKFLTDLRKLINYCILT